MPVNIDNNYREKVSRVVKRNLWRTDPIAGIFTILSSCRQRTQGHDDAVKLAKMNKGQSRVVRGFNLVATMEGHDQLLDRANVTHEMPSAGGKLVCN